jgi:hypothetical protein
MGNRCILAKNFFEKQLEAGRFLDFPPMKKIRASGKDISLKTTIAKKAGLILHVVSFRKHGN